LVKSGFRGDIYATPATRDLCSAMLFDSAHIQESDVKLSTSAAPRRASRRSLLYTMPDAIQALKQFVSVGITPVRAAARRARDVRDTGHILGSAMVILDVEGLP
jgi:metallo-beta-lactamase family protein